jgi:hypothetical protein
MSWPPTHHILHRHGRHGRPRIRTNSPGSDPLDPPDRSFAVGYDPVGSLPRSPPASTVHPADDVAGRVL